MHPCDILILIAMQAEANALLEQLRLTSFTVPELAPLPARSYQGSHQGANLVLVTQGQAPDGNFDYVGTQFAAVTSWVAIGALSPKVILNAGTAGGFIHQSAKIGDVYVNAKGCLYHDRRIGIPSYAPFCKSPIPSQIAQKLNQHLPWLKPGLISTGNALDTYPEEIARIQSSGAQVKDMEAATIAEIAALFNLEIIALKSITDHLDGEYVSADEFLDNLHLASAKLTEATIKVIDFLTETSGPLTG